MGGNNDDLFLQYMLEMGALNPEEEKLARQQQYVDTLRSDAATQRRGQMVSGHYVAPGFGDYAAQLGNAMMARHGMKKLHGKDGASGEYGAFQNKQIAAIRNLRDLMAQRRSGVAAAPATGAKGPYIPDDDIFAAPY